MFIGYYIHMLLRSFYFDLGYLSNNVGEPKLSIWHIRNFSANSHCEKFELLFTFRHKIIQYDVGEVKNTLQKKQERKKEEMRKNEIKLSQLLATPYFQYHMHISEISF